MHQHRYSSSCRQEGSLQRLKSHIGSMIRHNATITQIMLQQALFGNSTNASKSSVSKITKRENESQFKCLTWVQVYTNIHAPAFQKWAITSNFGWKKRWSTRYWPPGSGFISELFRSLMPTINTARAKDACCSFKAEVNLWKNRSPQKRQEQKSDMKTMDCALTFTRADNHYVRG